jgi:squalene-hopene/tetraprenyl-beta-curcumene cyclase
MKQRVLWACLSLAICVAVISVWRAVAARRTSPTYSAHWSQQKAAAYLDSREVWWREWPPAQRDHGTFCISCHTVVPYAMARSTLRTELGETGMAAPEKIMVDNVEKRVSHWSEMAPYYSDAIDGPGKTAQSRATEAVLNAVILASYDARQGHLRPITRTAFDNAWALQQNSGGWQWQDFDLAPWESAQSAYQGAALFLFEVGNAPDHYATEPEVQKRAERLRAYLRQQYATQPFMNKLYVLWASTKVDGLLTNDESTALLYTLQNAQQDDGSWKLSLFEIPKRSVRSLLPSPSDGLVTSLVVLVMEETNISPTNSTLKRGLAWLDQHQETDGNWPASSMNERRDPKSDIGRFMSDAATGFAVLALEKAK